MQTRTKQRIYDKFIEDRVIDEALYGLQLGIFTLLKCEIWDLSETTSFLLRLNG